MTNAMDKMMKKAPAGATPRIDPNAAMAAIETGEMSDAAAARISAIEAEEAAKAVLKKDGHTFYTAPIGCFSTAMPDGTAVSFLCGNYNTDDKEVIAYLEQFVASGKLIKE